MMKIKRSYLIKNKGESLEIETFHLDNLTQDKLKTVETKLANVRKVVGEEVKLNSNGETALEYFENKMKNDRLYCLDEPENSLSPKLQLELVEIIKRLARYCGCQFIIATHSPFVLSLPNAKIYDLDTNPVDIKKWWELENTKIYYQFFNKNKELFEKQ